MKKQLLALLVFFSLLPGLNAQTTLYYQDFSSVIPTFPANMTRIDNDGLTVNAAIVPPFTTTASWIVMVDSLSPTPKDTVMASTSWLSGSATASDWIITPQITLLSSNNVVQWNAKTRDTDFRDGYEVRIGTSPTVAAMTTVLYSNAGEDTAWQARTANIPALFNGQNVYIAFVNNSVDKFILLLDDIKVVGAAAPINDIALSNATNPSEYTSIPLSQAQSGSFSVGVTTGNLGNASATGVTVKLEVRNLTSNTIVNSQTLTGPATLAVGASSAYTGTTVPYAGLGIYEFRYVCTMTPLDANKLNDTIRRYVSIDPNLYARDNTILFGTLTNALGVNSGVVEVAQKFTVNNTTGVTLDTVFAYFNEKRVGARYRAKIYIAAAGIPGTLGATSLTYTTTPADTFGGANGVIGLVFSPALAPPLTGDYFVSVEQMDTFNFGLGYNANIATAGAAQLQINGGAWTASSGAGFPGAYVIWPHLKSASTCNLAVSATGTNPTCGQSNGSITTTVTGATGSPTYAWSNGQSTATAINLAPATYNVTVTSGSCTATASAALTNVGTTPVVTVSTTQSSCSSNTGTATVNGAAGGSSYSWNTTPSQSSATVSNLGAGTYTVTVTTTGCTATASGTVTTPAPPTFTTSSTQSSCSGSTGTASVNGAPGGSTYSWSNGQTSATATGLAGGNYTVTVTNTGCTATASVTVSTPAPPTFTTSSTPSSCSGSTGTAAANGAPGGSTYSWSTSPVQSSATATNLSAGSYTVTVTNNGCTATASVIVSNPNAPVASATGTNPLCFGGTGSAIASATGGTGGYTYQWGTVPTQTTITATNLMAGTYTVTVKDASLCAGVASVTITSPTQITATTSNTAVSCFNGNTGTASVSATGGTGSLTYTWNSAPAQSTATAINLTAGTYSVTVRDANQCTVTATTIVSQPSTALSGNVSKIDVPCFNGANGSATATAVGGTPNYAFAWSNGQNIASISALAPGSFTVTITDSKGCTATASTSISQPTAALAVTTSSSGTTSIASVTGGTSPYSYAWSTTPAQTTATATNLTAGTFTVTVTDSKGCTATASVTISSIKDLSAIGYTTLEVYPNPSNGQFTIKAGFETNTDLSISVYDVNGKIVENINLGNASTFEQTIQLTGLASGVYTIRLKSEKGVTSHKLMLK